MGEAFCSPVFKNFVNMHKSMHIAAVYFALYLYGNRWVILHSLFSNICMNIQDYQLFLYKKAHNCSFWITMCIKIILDKTVNLKEKLPRLREQVRFDLYNISNFVHADDATARHCKTDSLVISAINSRLWYLSSWYSCLMNRSLIDFNCIDHLCRLWFRPFF